MGDLTENMSRYEFACPDHCGSDTVDIEIPFVLERVRRHFSSIHGKVKVGINSGHRCKKHNKKVGGAKSSQHLTGRGCDFVVYRLSSGGEWVVVSAKIVAAYLRFLYPDKYGIAPYPGRTHFDTKSGAARSWVGK